MQYEINETTARRAKEMNSFYSYENGSATAEYRRMVEETEQVAAAQKTKVDPMYHETINNLLEKYKRKLAENLNAGYEIETRCPSVLVAGPARFPVRKKEKQNEARAKNMAEYEYIQALLDKIRRTGTGGISGDDKNATEKLKARVASLEADQERMKRVNVYYRKNNTLEGCADLTEDERAEIERGWANGWLRGAPYPQYHLANNNANIRRLRQRLEAMEKQKASSDTGWEFDGGRVELNKEVNRVQLFFDEKPDEEKRTTLKENGFRWAPSQKAWQRQLTENGIRAAKRITK